MPGAAIGPNELLRTPDMKHAWGMWRSMSLLKTTLVAGLAPTITMNASPPDHGLTIVSNGAGTLDLSFAMGPNLPMADSRFHSRVESRFACQVTSVGFMEIGTFTVVAAPVVIPPGTISAFGGFSFLEEIFSTGDYFFSSNFFNINHTDNQKGYILWNFSSVGMRINLGGAGNTVIIKDAQWRVRPRGFLLNVG